MNRADLLANHAREQIDQWWICRIEERERAGDLDGAGRLRLGHLAYALEGFRLKGKRGM